MKKDLPPYSNFHTLIFDFDGIFTDNNVLINQVGCFGINIGKIDFYLSGKEIKEESNSIKV